MTAYIIHRIGWVIMGLILMGNTVCYGADQIAQATDASPPAAKNPVASNKTAPSQPAAEKEAASQNSGLLSGLGDQIHDILEEERKKTLLEMDRERQATLDYLTLERLAATEDIKAERAAALAALEEMGYKITEHAVVKSKALIDHFFIRAAQFSAGFFLITGIFVYFFVYSKGRKIIS